MYKRQVLGHKARECMPCIMQAFIKKPEDVEKGLPFDRMPVSYTHLDVYKRQILYCIADVKKKTFRATVCNTA